MSDTTTPTTETTPAPAEPGPEAAEKAKRERASYPIRLLREDAADTFAKPSGPEFSTIEQAERWILRDGEPGVTYLLARVIGARRRPRPVLEDVAL